MNKKTAGDGNLQNGMLVITNQSITLFTRIEKQNSSYIVNSLNPDNGFMLLWLRLSLKMTACRMAPPTRHLSKCWLVINHTLQNKLQGNQNWNNNVFIHKNSIENVGSLVVSTSVHWYSKWWAQLAFRSQFGAFASGTAKTMTVRVNSDWEILSIYYLC